MSVTTTTQAIPVKNAGLVLANNYVPMLLERLGIVKNKAFVDVAAQEQGVHLLQYMATGMTDTEEQLLPLNKVLCGLSLTQQVPDGIQMPEAHEQTIDGLLAAMIGYWPAIGASTINGFRGNWLVRDGMLTELENHWQLNVDKRAYDILLQHAPFSFSIIRYPWMNKSLHVTWAY